ncbi:zinc knuckle CX2CX4HX4C containing protein [Tanacetum coccineum]
MVELTCKRKFTNENQHLLHPWRGYANSTIDEGLPQPPLVFPTSPFPLRQSNVDVAVTFGVQFTTVGDLDVLIKDIDAGKYEELLSGMTNDKRKLVMDALGALYDLIKADCASNHKDKGVSNVQIHNIDDVSYLFGVPLNSLKEIDTFVKDLELGKHELWTSASAKDQPKVNSNFHPLVVDPVFDGVNISIPHKVVKNVSTRFEHTLYGYFIGKRMAFSVVEYYARNNWAKHGLKRIMMNNKGFFFFKFDSRAGLEAVLEGGPWLICKSPIILKKWSMDTRLLKEELTRIPIWVKFHDVPIQVFEEDGISLIATFIGKPVDLVDVVTMGVPSLTREAFTKETIRVEYEWRPPRCDICKIYGHVHDQCPKKVVSPPIVTTSNVVTSTIVETNDGFQTVGKKKKKKGKSKSTNVGKFVGTSVNHSVRYEPKAKTSDPKKNGNESKSSSMLKTADIFSKKVNFTTSNYFSALNDEEEDEEENVENVYDESANLFTNTKISGSSSFTAAVG